MNIRLACFAFSVGVCVAASSFAQSTFSSENPKLNCPEGQVSLADPTVIKIFKGPCAPEIFHQKQCPAGSSLLEGGGTGSARRSVFCVDDEKGQPVAEGPYAEFYDVEMKRLKVQGEMAKGGKVGPWRSYDELHSKKTDMFYKDGELNGDKITYGKDGHGFWIEEKREVYADGREQYSDWDLFTRYIKGFFGKKTASNATDVKESQKTEDQKKTQTVHDLFNDPELSEAIDKANAGKPAGAGGRSESLGLE